MASRKLTINEIKFAKEIFDNSVKYDQISIFDEKYAFFQPDNSGMTPNGNIYVDGVVSPDYGAPSTRAVEKAFFIHEMVHVWQKHNNILNPIVSAVANSLRHGFFYDEAYKYTLENKKDLLGYRMEQQAQIIEDYIRIVKLNLLPKPKFLQNKIEGKPLLGLYKSVLSHFLANPAYPSKDR